MSEQQNSLEQKLVKNLLADRRSDRRWRNIRTAGWIILLLIYAALIFMPTKPKFSHQPDKPYVALVRLNGLIMPGSTFSARKVIPSLNKAFADSTAKGVVLLINSPGGSPVQSAIIHDRIEYLKHKYKKKVVVVGEDTLASGAYLVSTAADRIYVNNDTLTGSIGVIMSGFGLTDAIQKLGISRRVFTAGENKDRLDPFKPMSAADKQKVQRVLNQVHENFIEDVKQGRQGKLTGNPAELFSGDFWTGAEAVKLGLADGVANLWTVTQKEFGVSHYRDYSVHPSLLQALLKGAATQLHLTLNSSQQSLQAIMP